MTKFYVDAGGNYLGGFDGADPPIGAIEVAFPPEHGLDIWNGTQWIPTPRTNPNQDLIDEINAATNIGQIKTAMRNMLTRIMGG